MKLHIVNYWSLNDSTNEEIREAVWVYCYQVGHGLFYGQPAAVSVHDARSRADVVARELEVMTPQLGEKDWHLRHSVIAAMRAVIVICSQRKKVPARTIKLLGNAISRPGMPQCLTFTVKGKGALKVNLVALYVHWVRSQYRHLAAKKQLCLR